MPKKLKVSQTNIDTSNCFQFLQGEISRQLHNYLALGTSPARGPWGFRHHGTSRRQSPTSAHARCRAGNGEERGRTLRARNPATLPLKSPQQAAWRSPRLSQGPMAASPPRKSHSESFVGQTRGPALGTAPARGPWGFRHHGTSRRQSPTSALPLKSPQQAAWRLPLLSQGPMAASPPRKSRGSRTGAARLRMGREGECARTGDSNPRCNYPVRGYSPSMLASPCGRPGTGLVDVLAGWRACARGLVRALTPPWLQQSRASHQPVLPF